jgi:hypothetical protein
MVEIEPLLIERLIVFLVVPKVFLKVVEKYFKQRLKFSVSHYDNQKLFGRPIQRQKNWATNFFQ